MLTRDRDILCGDLLMNMLGGPRLEFFIDDLAAATDSAGRLGRSVRGPSTRDTANVDFAEAQGPALILRSPRPDLGRCP